jgi:co-chaperonin GroES (HSP10)
MTQREKMLAGAVAAVGVLWGGMRGLDRYRTAVDRNEGIAAKAKNDLDDAEFAVQRGMKAKQRLIQWGKRSLPTDRDVAESLYQDWVRKELAAAGLTIEQVTDKTLNRRAPHYGELSVEARANGTLEQLSNFLYKFYAAPHLHRLSAATITPSENGSKLAIVLGIDALILTESPRKAELSSEAEQKLPATQEEFKTQLVSRNVFAPHTPGNPNAGQAGGAEASTIVSAGDGGYHLWVRTESPDKTHKFKVGDKLEFADFKGTLVAIDGEQLLATIEKSDGKVVVRLGQKLSEAKKVDEPKREDGNAEAASPAEDAKASGESAGGSETPVIAEAPEESATEADTESASTSNREDSAGADPHEGGGQRAAGDAATEDERDEPATQAD